MRHLTEVIFSEDYVIDYVFIMFPNDQKPRRINSPKYIHFLFSTKLGSLYC